VPVCLVSGTGSAVREVQGVFSVFFVTPPALYKRASVDDSRSKRKLQLPLFPVPLLTIIFYSMALCGGHSDVAPATKEMQVCEQSSILKLKIKSYTSG
jgi:hypothetical protein